MEGEGCCEDCGEYYEDCECNEGKMNGATTPTETELALQSLCGKLAADPAVLTESLRQMSAKLASNLENSVRGEMLKVMQKFVAEEASKMARPMLEGLLAEVLESQIVIGGESWEQKKMSIRDVVKKELGTFIAKLSNERDRSQTVQMMVSKVLQEDMAQKIAVAVEEVKRETIDQVKQDMMKSIVAETAKIVAKDVKLLTLMEATKK